MGVKIQQFNQIQGMNQDISPSKRPDKLAYEIKNMRITIEEDNTLMSWSNEKGTKLLTLYDLTDYEDGIKTPVTINGIILGTCLLNDYLILFVKQDESTDLIQGINFKYKIPLLYTFYSGDLNFQLDSKFESLGVFENKVVQKVYWIDGVNQPRLINIAGDLSKIKQGLNTQFDFLPTDNQFLTVSIEKVYQTGLFKAGTVQYAFNYFNQYGPQSNIVYQTPIQYVSIQNRGLHVDDRVNCAFKITCSGLNTKFDYIRIYSISRTSVDTTPQVRIVKDVPLSSALDGMIQFTDNGEGGTAFDYNALLFLNNLKMSASTMDQKDNTLFLGDLQYASSLDLELKKLFANYNAKDIINFTKIRLLQDSAEQYYPYTNQLHNSINTIAGFKGGESYVFGFILQDLHDRWTSVIPLQGVVTNTLYPEVTFNKNNATYETYIVQAYISQEVISEITTLANTLQTYKAIKFVIVSSTESQRSVLCQGIVAPTVYCGETRTLRSTPFAQSSWFFRPIMKKNPLAYLEDDNLIVSAYDNHGSILEFRHFASLSSKPASTSPIPGNYNLNHPAEYTKEIQAGTCTTDTIGYNKYLFPDVDNTQEININSSCLYGVDTSILTMHSPDIQFNSIVQNLLEDNSIYNFRIVGYTTIHNTYSDSEIDLEQTSATITDGDKAYTANVNSNTGKKANLYYTSVPAASLNYWLGGYGKDTYKHTTESDEAFTSDNVYFRVYPWNRQTTIGIQSTPTVKASATSNKGISETDWHYPIKTKVISNFRVCGKTKLGLDYYWRPIAKSQQDSRGCSSIAIWTPQSKLEKIVDTTSPLAQDITYEGNIDTVIVPPAENGYTAYAYTNKGLLQGVDKKYYSVNLSQLIEMKYNSSEHAVFSLGYNIFTTDNVEKYQQWILPAIVGSDEINNVTIPYHLEEGETLPWNSDGGLVSEEINYNVIESKDYPEDSGLFNTIATNQRSIRTLGQHAINWGEITEYIKNWEVVLGEYTSDSGRKYTITNGHIEFKAVVIMNWENSIGVLNRETAKYYVIHYKNKTLYSKPDIHSLIEQDTMYVIVQNEFNVGTIIKDAATGERYRVIIDNRVERVNDSTESTEDQVEDKGEAIGDATKPYALTTYKVEDEDDGVFLIGEFYQPSTLSTKDYDLASYTWQSCSDIINLNTSSDIKLFGDTYFQRYDCLKTYPVADTDHNQIVDIASFIVESRINLDGRWDRNRGNLSNLNMNPANFNLINEAYSQQDKVTNSYLPDSTSDIKHYPNSITWTLTKVFGEQIDSWTHLTSTTLLDLDGDRGHLEKILNFRNTLIFFQDEGLGYIKYNENVALQSSGALPIELGNSGKVDGKLYLNEIIGCQNKDTIVISKNAVYFIDGHTETIYQLTEPQSMTAPVALSDNAFNLYLEKQDLSQAKAFYNREKQEVYFTFSNLLRPCLTYNEQVQAFTAFYEYRPNFMYNIGTRTIHLVNNIYTEKEGYQATLWGQNEGEYNYFYTYKLRESIDDLTLYRPFYMTIVGNGQQSEAMADKIWDNLEFRADSWNNQTLLNTTFDHLYVWNEYQDGVHFLTRLGEQLIKPDNKAPIRCKSINIPSSLKKKFRIWRANIPRSYYDDNNVYLIVKEKDVKDLPDPNRDRWDIAFNNGFQSRDRIRNPWTYIQLAMEIPNTNRTVLHDMVIHYYQ